MKTFTKLSTLILAVGLATSAHAADTFLYITGSTAYRSNTTQAILKYLGATGVSASSNTADLGSGNKYGYVGSTWSGAKSATFITGTAGSRTIIKTSWSGSEAGIQAVCNPGTVTVKFLPAAFDTTGDTTLTQTGAGSLTDPTTSGGAASTYEAHTADACMSDTFQSSSRFTSPTLTDAVAGGSSQAVGIVPFLWVVQKGAPSGISNMSPNMAQSLYTGSGFTSAQMLSGNAADASVRIYALGRDIDSGTRVTAFAESGIGINSTVKQWRPNLPQGGSSITAFAAVSGNTYTWTTTNSTVNIASGSIANIGLGYSVVGTGIPANTIVGSFVDPSNFKLIDRTTSAAVTPTIAGTASALTIAANGTLKQTTGTQSNTVSKYWSQYPGQTINGVAVPTIGQGGESSGGNVVTWLSATGSTTTGYGIAYLGSSDANSAVKAGAVALSYDGVSIVTAQSASGITFDFTNIKLGSYKFWGYEHLFYNVSTIVAGVKTAADGVANQIFNTDAQVLIDSTVQVTRATDGAPVTTSLSATSTPPL